MGRTALSFVAGGNLGQTTFQTLATPVQNNGSIYNVIYTYTKGPWIIQPYFQYTDVPTNATDRRREGCVDQRRCDTAESRFQTRLLARGAWEYITSSGSVAEQAVNLMFGPGSGGWSVTLTPTFQHGGFFVRGDLSCVHATSYTPGYVFGPTGMNQNQPRAMAEIGFMFGNNISGKKP